MSRLFFTLTLVALQATLAAAPQGTAADYLVVPGQRLGKLQLGADAGTSLPVLGKPNFSDAAMQKAWATWYGPRPTDGTAPTQVDVYTAPLDNDVDRHTVQVVRATSPWFHLSTGLRPGSELRAIEARYGHLPLSLSYELKTGKRYLYDDVAQGIAFEIDGTAPTNCCRAILVHLPGKALASNTLPLAAYLSELP